MQSFVHLIIVWIRTTVICIFNNPCAFNCFDTNFRSIFSLDCVFGDNKVMTGHSSRILQISQDKIPVEHTSLQAKETLIQSSNGLIDATEHNLRRSTRISSPPERLICFKRRDTA